MVSKTITLAVRPRGKPIKGLPEDISITLDDSGLELYKQLAKQSDVSVHRLRVTKGSDGSLVPQSKDFTVDKTGLREQSTIYVKDLGPQIAWRTVFLIEYLGPLAIHPLFFFLRSYVYRTSSQPSTLQTLAFVLITLHFAKREIETLFIHRFSNATMPAFNIVKNSAHYWLLAGFNMAYWIYSPKSPTAKESNSFITYSAIVLYICGEAGNLSTHLALRELRSEGGNERGIPRGSGFNLVTCPNYMFEAVAWLGIWLVTWSSSAGLFTLVALVQMALWSKKKEAKYRREFGGEYKRKRYTMIPAII